MSSDSERRVRGEIENVLGAYGVTYEHVNRGKHSAYQFDVNGKTVTFTYSSGDPRTHLNARSDLRGLLLKSGLKEKEAQKRSILTLSKQENLPVPKQTLADCPRQPDIVNGHSKISETIEPKATTIMDSPPATPVTEPITPPAQGGFPTPPVLTVSSGYTYQSPKVLGIKLDRDILVTAGNMLVIPLNRPNTVLEMTEDQFLSLFEIVKEQGPSEPAPESKKATGRPAASVPPQIGRILTAMAYVTKQTGKVDVSTAMVTPYLEGSDARQFSSRMPVAAKSGLVEQGLPYQDRRGYHYKLTTKAYHLIKEIKCWPYEIDGRATPDWLASIL